MTNREIVTENKLSSWAKVFEERASSGMSVREYCETKGINKKAYYYWQTKQRKATQNEITSQRQKEHTIPLSTTIPSEPLIPEGWTLCGSASVTEPAEESKTLPIEIGACRVMADSTVDPELLAKVCRVLVTLC